MDGIQVIWNLTINTIDVKLYQPFMPELPEVETVRTGLARSWIDKRIDGVELRREGLRFPFPDGLEERLTGRKITQIRRRAKYLLIDLDNDDILLSLIHI